MFKKSFWLGIMGGILCVSLIGWDVYTRINSPVVANPDENVTQIESETQINADVPGNSTTPNSISTPKPTTTPTPKPTVKPTSVPTPTPTPKPLLDYYVQSHSQILLPENTSNVTEYSVTQVYPKMRLEVDFGVNNAKAGDSVEMKIYEDGSVQQTQSRQVPSGTNAVFADVYYAKARNIGTHTVRFVYNENKSVTESNYGNNEYTFTFKITGETTPPTFTIDGPYVINGQTCMRWVNLSDNVSVYTDVWAKWKIDGADWSGRTSENPYGCISGTTGSSHTYYVHAEDAQGNVREDSRTFTLQ
ncbi:hypothetical protein KBD75_04065 [Candidatus Woesebacteria bacterium]|nr:hypothetical protein [Candidatus Woesebacteria bacterium]